MAVADKIQSDGTVASSPNAQSSAARRLSMSAPKRANQGSVALVSHSAVACMKRLTKWSRAEDANSVRR